MSVGRLYRDGDVWIKSARFDRDDIPLLRLALAEAYQWLLEQQSRIESGTAAFTNELSITPSPLTRDGIADFHAAGRHTHITELLRNGASLGDAPTPWLPAIARVSKNPLWECATERKKLGAPGSDSGVSACHNGTHGDTGVSSPPNDASPVGDRACRQKSSPDLDCPKWRRRESKGRMRNRNALRVSRLRRRPLQCLHYVCTVMSLTDSHLRRPTQG
jgi:hypothetical protein